MGLFKIFKKNNAKLEATEEVKADSTLLAEETSLPDSEEIVKENSDKVASETKETSKPANKSTEKKTESAKKIPQKSEKAVEKTAATVNTTASKKTDKKSTAQASSADSKKTEAAAKSKAKDGSKPGVKSASASKSTKAVTNPKSTAKKNTVTESGDVEIREYEEIKPEKFTGKFDIKKTKDNRYVFNLYSTNHIIVATSQVYSSAQSAMVGINSVIANAHKTPIEDQTLKEYQELGYPKWEIYLDKGGHYRFKLNASNGSCVCHSQGYTSKSNCKKGIESIIKCSRNPEIDKSYLKKSEE